MRRTKSVLAVVAVMAAMLVAFSAPAMANNTNDDNVQRSNSNIFGDNGHNDGFNHRGDNNDDDVIFLVSDGDFDDFEFDDDFEWWGSPWSWWGGCEGPVCGLD
jgi:hypothetical protein